MGQASKLKALLCGNDWFASLPGSLADALVQAGRLKSLNAHDVIIRQGDRPSGLHAILSGQAHVEGVTPDGDEVLIALLHSGEWTGFLACLDKQPYAFTVTAVENMKVFSVPLGDVRRIFYQDAETLAHLVKPELAASRKVYRYLIESVTYSPIQRLARRLLDLSQAAYDETDKRNVIKHVSQQQIATTIMASRQWTNRILGQLERRGIVKVSRSSIKILDRPKLTRIAEIGEETDGGA